MAEFDEMARGRFARPTRWDDEVHRRPMHDNTEVHRFLRHLEAVGFTRAPRFLGMTEDGAERLSYIAGTTGYPPLSEDIRSDEALVDVARAIRELHDASLGFTPAAERWHGYEFARPATFDCIGHYDLAPWNMVFEQRAVVGIIDWDAAGPSSRVWDLAYAAYQFVPFHAADGLSAWGWTTEPDRRERLRLFLDSYGGDIEPAELVDTAVLRIYGIGAYIDKRVRAGDPAFKVQAAEGHGAAFKAAAVALAGMRSDLI